MVGVQIGGGGGGRSEGGERGFGMKMLEVPRQSQKLCICGSQSLFLFIVAGDEVEGLGFFRGRGGQ